MFFTDRNKALVTVNTRVKNITRCYACNKFTNRNRFSDKTLTFSLYMLTGLQEVAGSIEISVTGKKKLALKKVEEVLETVLSNLELTRVPEIVDI